jgi:hypothetical protein
MAALGKQSHAKSSTDSKKAPGRRRLFILFSSFHSRLYFSIPHPPIANAISGNTPKRVRFSAFLPTNQRGIFSLFCAQALTDHEK